MYFANNICFFFVAGYNASGYLVPGTEVNQPTPILFEYFIKTDILIKDVSISGGHTAFLTNKGKVYTMGANGSGQLGLENFDIQKEPVIVSFFESNNIIIDKIYCKYHRSFFLTSDGDIYCCGDNPNGELGLSSSKTHKTQIQLHPYFKEGGSRGATSPKISIIDVAMASNHTWFLTDNGHVYGCGSNHYGQLGLGNLNNQSTPQKITYFNDIPISKIAAGAAHVMFLANNGSIYGIGNNQDGQLGLGYTTQGTDEIDKYVKTIKKITYFDNINIKDIVCGNNESFFLTNNGKVYCCGNNGMGEIRFWTY